MKKKLLLDSIFMILLLLNVFGLYSNVFLASAFRTIRVPDEYDTIQKAINAADPGDTILVAKGTYHEYVLVNKSVTLLGENRESIIDGAATPSRIIDVIVSNVKISGFTVQNKGSYKGIYVVPPYGQTIRNVNITDNNLINNNVGVFFSYSTNVYVGNNTFNGNYYSIRLHDSDYNTIQGNKINGSIYYGVNFYSHSDNNKIDGNRLSFNTYGILLEYSDSNTVSLNTIESSKEYAVRLSYSSGTLTKGNNIMNNKYGAYIWNCSGNQFYHNNFIDNTYQVEHYAAALTANIWDTNVRPGTEGNYWSDYTGVDDGSGVGRWGESRVAGDSVGDTKIPHLGVDWYPLMHPWALGPYPVAIFTYSPPEPIVNQPATFNASKSYDPNGTIVSYKWDFGDGTTGNGIVVGKVYNRAGNYTVTLTITNNQGEEDTTSRLMTVIPIPVGLAIDLYNQKGGQGPNEASGDFAPRETVILTASLTFYEEPVEYKFVAFEVIDPTGETVLDRSNVTNVNGLAQITFTIPIIPIICPPEIFGKWIVFAVSSVSEQTVSDTLTFEVKGPILDVYTQKPDPYSGRGLDQPCDAFAPQEEVILYADVHHNCEPVEYKPVGFEIKDPYSVTIDYRTAFSDASGIASTSIRLASNATFGIYTVIATVSISGQTANDTLTFRVGWIIETLMVETVNAIGTHKTSFARGEHICFNLTAKNIAFVSKTVTFTIVACDEQDAPIGRAVLQGWFISPGKSEIFVVDVQIPKWSCIGSAMVYANAYTDLPVNGGVPYCPEISTVFLIVP